MNIKKCLKPPPSKPSISRSPIKQRQFFHGKVARPLGEDGRFSNVNGKFEGKHRGMDNKNTTNHMDFGSDGLFFTLPEPNSKFAPKNGWLEYYFPIGMAYFSGAFAVSFREGNVVQFCQKNNAMFQDSE